MRRAGWTDDEIKELRRRWMADERTLAIGAAMGRSKNAIVGMAHRIGLPERASPIIRDGRPRKTRVPVRRDHPAVALPTLSSVAALVIPAPSSADSSGRKSASVKLEQEKPMPIVRQPREAPRCCWPTWTDADKATGRYWQMLHHQGTTPICGKPAARKRERDGTLGFSPYCADHHARAFTPVQPMRRLPTARGPSANQRAPLDAQLAEL